VAIINNFLEDWDNLQVRAVQTTGKKFYYSLNHDVLDIVLNIIRCLSDFL